MELGLRKQVERFYNEMENDHSFDIGELACNLVPKLVYKIEQLEKEIKEMTSEKVTSDQRR